MIKKIFLLFFLLLPLCSSSDSLVSIDYGNETVVEKKIESSNVLVKIITSEESSCRYDIFRDIQYSQMTGRFDITNGNIHKITFQDLKDGGHNFYFKCLNATGLEPKEVSLNINSDSLIYGEISLSRNTPISSGNIEVELTTSKIPASTPYLRYSFGEDIYEIALEGRGLSWKGYILIEESLGESILSFSFRAEDLEGRVGTELKSGRVFTVDTIRPDEILEFEVVPKENELQLNWHTEERVEKVNIYRSTSQDVGKISFYKTVSGSSYIDKNIENGVTYYYRISATDAAGNEGDLSKEKYSIATRENATLEQKLSPVLVNEVNNFLSKLSSLRKNLEEYSILKSATTEKEKELISILKLNKMPENKMLEINSIKNIAENCKDQDMSKEELKLKLDSLDMKLKVIQREFPVGIKILEEYSSEKKINEELVRRAISKYDQSLSEEAINNIVQVTMKTIEEELFDIKSWHGLVQVDYYDSSKSEFSITKREIQSTLELMDNAFFLEVFPAELYDSIEDLEITNINAEILKEKEMVSVDSSTKYIGYYLSGNSIKDIKNIDLVFIKAEGESVKSKGITGYFILNTELKNNSLLLIFAVISFILLLYLFIVKRQNLSEDYFKVRGGLSEMLGAIKNEDISLAKDHYKNLQSNYPLLQEKERKRIYSKLESAKTKILIAELKKDLVILEKSKDKNLLSSLENKIKKFPENIRKKIEPLFNKIKNEMHEQ